MNRKTLRKHARWVIASSLATVLFAGSLAWAAGVIPGEDGVIHGCYSNTKGALRVIDPTTDSCGDRESAIFWNQEGVPGQNGTNGLDGTNGVDGTNGLDGKTVLNGTTAPDERVGTLGDFYLDTASSMIYGPLTEAGWGEGTSLLGPAGATGTNGTDGTAGTAGATGAQGPQGATGATGAQGPQGSPGVSGYEIVSLSGNTVAANSTGVAWVECPIGKLALGGGGASGSSLVFIQASTPFGPGVFAPGATWIVRVTNTSNTATTFSVVATCANVS